MACLLGEKIKTPQHTCTKGKKKSLFTPVGGRFDRWLEMVGGLKESAVAFSLKE